MSERPAGHLSHSQPTQLAYDATWTVFGPVAREARTAKAALKTCPAATLTVAGRRLPRRTTRVRNGVLDLDRLVGGTHREGRSAYVFIAVTAPQAGTYRIGLGADWWLEAWLDGRPLGNTLVSGNGPAPAAASDHAFTAWLGEGPHCLAVRVRSGSAGFVLAAGDPVESEDQIERQRRRNLGASSTVLRPLKIVFLGAGSGFLNSLFPDILSIPGADRGEMCLVDIDAQRLALADKMCRRIVAAKGSSWRIAATTDRRQVLRGADYVINCIEVSGVECVAHDNDIPLRYGVDQCIGDTTGPGGLFKALRTVPVWLAVLADIERLCPGAWVLNYTNPMSILCLAAARASTARVVGLCHSVQGASHALAGWANVPYHELEWACAGVNHLAWFTELRHRGRDLYPALKERVRRDPVFAERDLVRFDLMEHFGFYCTESSGHDSEYLPYYRKRPDLLKKYCRPGYSGGSRFYADNWPAWRKQNDANRRALALGTSEPNLRRSWEYAGYIIQAMETNTPFVIHGNMPNRGLITNLPGDGIVEVACLVDRRGVQATHYGALPAQCAALCDWNMRFFDLAATACIERSKAAAAHALMLDPLTAAVCCPAEIRRMTEDLFRAEKAFLPGYR